MPNPYRQSGGRVSSGDPAPAPRPTARPRGGRPMANGQPTYPEGFPPIPGGPPTRASDQGILGPLAPPGPAGPSPFIPPDTPPPQQTGGGRMPVTDPNNPDQATRYVDNLMNATGTQDSADDGRKARQTMRTGGGRH